MTKKDRQHLGRLIMRVHLSPYQRYQLIESLPYLSAKKLKQVYMQLQAIEKKEQGLIKSVNKMKAAVESGKISV